SEPDGVLAGLDAITALRKYYVVNDPPEVGNLEWVNFYGQFRLDLDQYIQSRDAYLEELSNLAGSPLGLMSVAA
ncbi:hypothetical protein, partial [Roseibium sp. RKSG952]|uniref:hypothetical protein n=1 Tax=Roseibium sp. RKSG952 TaxID=2529384 RepID=UPI0018AD18C9